MLFGWCAEQPEPELLAVGRLMAQALRVHAAQRVKVATLPGLTIGVFDLPPLANDAEGFIDGVRSTDGAASLWMAGEAFSWPSRQLSGATESRTAAFHRRLLDTLLAEGDAAIADLNGEYQVALWEHGPRRLRIWTDRFGALPLYSASSAQGTAFAGGVRGVLMAPGISCDPDPEAIREAVSFGGFRLGGRTNVRAVTMAPPACAMTMTARERVERRYWHWDQLDLDASADAVTLPAFRDAWGLAVARRLEGSGRPGLTLSGGLDSRAVLAEVARQGRRASALTYGVPESDDVRFAQRAARAAGATWHVHSLFEPGWLATRTAQVLPTDGLLNLVDVMHLEPLALMPSLFDAYLSGYIGDAVSGSSLDYIETVDDVLRALPYYGVIGLTVPQARDVAAGALARLRGAPRFVVYDHKLPQSTNRITGAARPFVRVRRPFVDYQFFELAQRVPTQLRADHRWHEQWLKSTYPDLFGTIPNQRTATPVGASSFRRQVTRTRRYAWRRLLGGLRGLGAPVRVPSRSFHPDEEYWSRSPERATIEETIMRPGSVSCEVLGREAVGATLETFFRSGAAPVQVIGALFVYEYYHRHLAPSLSGIRQQAGGTVC